MIRVVHIGIGPMGARVVASATARADLRIVGAVDIDPAKVGQDVGTLSGARRLGVTVSPTLSAALRRRSADVAVIATVSGLRQAAGQIEEAARAGLRVVSTCEELSFPWRTQPRIAARLDRVCREYGVACVGTGVNPGFLMDYLPCVLTSACRDVRHVTVSRIQDASQRRIPFQRKIGAGLTLAEFKAKAASGTLRHVGLRESMDMIAQALGWRLSRTTESLRPVIARRPIGSGEGRVAKGRACGVEQVGCGYRGGREAIRLYFRAAVGEKISTDTVEIDGDPPIVSTIQGGLRGDVATCAMTLNAVRAIVRAGSGLKTMLDLPVPGCPQNG